MIVKVGKHKIKIEKELINEKEINITKCQFIFDEDITNEFVKEAYFTQNGTSYKQIIVNNECDIPYEVLAKKGEIEIGVVAFLVENGKEITRYNPMPDYITTLMGSLKDNAENSEPITPTDKEQIESAIASIQAEQVTQNEGISQNTSDIGALREGKQDKLISGQNIKTINNESLIGAGNLEVITDLSDYYTKGQTDGLLDDKADKSEIPDVSEFITKDVDNLTNYTKTNDMNTAINTAVGNERTNRESSDVALQNQIDAITASSDVVDVVSTYQDLLNYSTTSLTEDDIIKVMQDESHSNAISYFRWQLSTWNYIGSEGPFYTKGETDTLLNNKANISDLPDLTDYVKNTDYATSSKGGVAKISPDYGSSMSANGQLIAATRTYTQYQNGANGTIIGKATLENVITGKQLINQTTLEDSQAEQDTTIEGLQAELDRYKLLENALPHAENETASDYVTLQNTAKAPMKIEAIPQTSQETTSGKNQIGLQNYATTTKNGLTFSVNNDEITINGTATAKVDFEQLLFNLSSNTTKTLSFYLESGSFSKGAIGIHFNEINDNQIAFIQIGYETTNLKGTKTISLDNIAKGYIYAISGSQFDNTKFKVMLSDNADESYEPYTGGIAAPNPDFPMDIHRTTGENQVKVVNGNLLNMNTFVKGRLDSGNLGYESGTTSISVLNNIVNFVTNTRNRGISSDFIEVLPSSDYVYSAEDLTLVNPNFVFYDKNKNWISDYRNYSTIKKCTTPENCYYLRLAFVPSDIGTYNLTKPQLVYGENQVPFIEHEETTYPISLGDKEMFNNNNVSDGFFYDETEDKFYIERKNGKVVFDGSENWKYRDNYTPADRFVLDNFADDMKLTSRNGYSNYFTVAQSITGTYPYLYLNGDQLVINFSEKGTTTLEDFKSWLSTHNTIVVYPLATPTLEEITDTTLISQLRAIKNALSMQGMTHIISTSSGTNLPFLIKARAVQNISNS